MAKVMHIKKDTTLVVSFFIIY